MRHCMRMRRSGTAIRIAILTALNKLFRSLLGVFNCSFRFSSSSFTVVSLRLRSALLLSWCLAPRWCSAVPHWCFAFPHSQLAVLRSGPLRSSLRLRNNPESRQAGCGVPAREPSRHRPSSPAGTSAVQLRFRRLRRDLRVSKDHEKITFPGRTAGNRHHLDIDVFLMTSRLTTFTFL